MILAFQQVFSQASMEIFSDEMVFSEKWEYKKDRDLLLHITKALEEAKITPEKLTGIFIINGPGNFSPVRSTCLIANTFAQELGIPIFSLSSAEITQEEDLMTIFQGKKPEKTDFVEAILAPPSVS